MRSDPLKFPIKELVDAWNSGSLKINREYQRGASWKATQMQGLVDSVFRKYPLPPVFLHKVTTAGLGGHETIRYEVVDGQQRIRSFADFFSDKFQLLNADDKQLRLPNSLRKLPAPWGGRCYSQLDLMQRNFLETAEVDAFVLTDIDNTDEVRDLFIRLQSGTALNRQQVRDAWPGNIGPYIESLAGKLSREPSVALFGLIDRRSDRGDEDKDGFTVNRQVCAQVLTLFLARQRDPLTVQSITADDLDRLYHANTEFDFHGATAALFRLILDRTAAIIEEANTLSIRIAKSKIKHKKPDVFSVFFLVQDLSSNPLFKFDPIFRTRVAEHLVDPPDVVKKGKSVSGTSIFGYYEQWRSGLPQKLGLHLDGKRLFDEHQKKIIADRQMDKCAICQSTVVIADAEYDHHPVPHYLGGATDIDNGRLVCSKCHPRGRPFAGA